MGDLAAAAVTLSHLGLAFRTRPSLPPPCPSPPAAPRPCPCARKSPSDDDDGGRAAPLWLSAPPAVGDVTGCVTGCDGFVDWGAARRRFSRHLTASSELAHTRNAHIRTGQLARRPNTNSGKRINRSSSSGRGTLGERLGSRAEARAGLRAFGQRSCAAKDLFEESAHRTHTHARTDTLQPVYSYS